MCKNNTLSLYINSIQLCNTSNNNNNTIITIAIIISHFPLYREGRNKLSKKIRKTVKSQGHLINYFLEENNTITRQNHSWISIFRLRIWKQNIFASNVGTINVINYIRKYNTLPRNSEWEYFLFFEFFIEDQDLRKNYTESRDKKFVEPTTSLVFYVKMWKILFRIKWVMKNFNHFIQDKIFHIFTQKHWIENILSEKN